MKVYKIRTLEGATSVAPSKELALLWGKFFNLDSLSNKEIEVNGVRDKRTLLPTLWEDLEAEASMGCNGIPMTEAVVLPSDIVRS